jgi:hypothetical protein
MKRRFLIFLSLAIVLPACGQTPTQYRPLPSSLGDLRGVAMGFTGLQILTEDQGLYAAWINLDRGELVGLGSFNVNAEGRPINVSDGTVIDRFPSTKNLFKSVSLVITIENRTGIGDGPSQSVILQGPFIDGIAELRVPAPLGIELSSGSYRVFTPTDGPDTNENSGVWAVSVDNQPLLGLPPLNNVYRYEHYVVIDGVEVTMAGFQRVDEPDFNNPWSGPLEAPQFPGEDFLENAPSGLVFPTDLSGRRILVTLEPVLGDTVDASQLVILEGTLPAGLQGGEIVELVNVTENFPTGVAAIY